MSTFTPEARARIDAHLDAVEQQLAAAGAPREKRRGIVDDLETHILDMIESAAQPTLTASDVDELLSQLDPPEAYGKDQPLDASAEKVAETTTTAEPNIAATVSDLAANAAAGPRRLSRHAFHGAWLIVLAIVAQVLVTLAFTPTSVHVTEMSAVAVTTGASAAHPPPTVATPPTTSGSMILLMSPLVVLAVVPAILGTALGWSAARRIALSGGRVYGVTLAVFDALLYPVILAWVASFALWSAMVIGIYGDTSVPNRGRAICLVGGLCTAVVLSAALAWLLRRTFRRAAPKEKRKQTRPGDGGGACG